MSHHEQMFYHKNVSINCSIFSAVYFLPSINHSFNFGTCLFSRWTSKKNHVGASVGSTSAKHDPIIAGQMLGARRSVVVGRKSPVVWSSPSLKPLPRHCTRAGCVFNTVFPAQCSCCYFLQPNFVVCRIVFALSDKKPVKKQHKFTKDSFKWR